MQLPNGGYLYFDVTGITPSHDRSIAEVKDQVEARWRDDEVAKRLQAKADDLLGKLKAGTALEQLATENGLKVEKVSDLQRGKSAPNAPAKLVDAAFKTAKGAAGSAEGDQATQRFIYRVTEVDRSDLRCQVAAEQVARDVAAEFLRRRHHRRIYRAAGKATTASRSIRRRSTRSSATPRSSSHVPLVSAHVPLIPAKAGIQDCVYRFSGLLYWVPLSRGRAAEELFPRARDTL